MRDGYNHSLRWYFSKGKCHRFFQRCSVQVTTTFHYLTGFEIISSLITISLTRATLTPPSIEMTNQRDQVKNSLFLANLVSTIVCESLKNHSETYYKVDPIFNIFYGQTVQGLSLVQSNLGYELHTPCGKLDIVMIKNHFRKDVQGATASAIAQSKDLTLVPFFGRIPLQSQRLDIVQSWKIQALQHSGRTYLLATSEYQHPQTYRHRSEIDPLIKEFHDSIKFSVEDD